MPVIHDDPQLFISLVTREDWGAKPATEDLSPLELPVVYVRYTSTDTEKCNTTDHCMRLMGELQQRSMENDGLPDIRYNFMVGGDGKVYEGRGWTHDADRTPELDKVKGKCVDIAYSGKYTSEHPTWEMLKVGLDLLKHGLKHEHVSPLFEIIPYRDDSRKN